MRLAAAFTLTAMLAGCGSSDMAYMAIQGTDHSLTLLRDKPYFWSDGWDLAVVVSRMPDCMRRHHLKHVGDGTFRMEVFRTPQARWVLHQGKRWYIADTDSCQLQQFEQPPEQPGDLVGTFDDKSGTLKFVQSPDLKKVTESTAPAK
jgi:hypothetical protein